MKSGGNVLYNFIYIVNRVVSGEIYTAGKNFYTAAGLAVTALTNFISDTLCDLYQNYPQSASISLHVHGFIFISSPIKVPACVHLDWILRSGGEGGPQSSCISSTHAKVCLFDFSCCCNFLSWYLLNQMNCFPQLFELGNIDARGEFIIATMTISKPSMTNDIFTSNYIAKISKRDNHTNHDYTLLYQQIDQYTMQWQHLLEWKSLEWSPVFKRLDDP